MANVVPVSQSSESSLEVRMRRLARGGMGVAVGMALAVGAPDSTTAQQTAARDFYAELTRGVGAKTELSGGNSFEETLIVELYFYASTADSSDLEIDVVRPGGKSKSERVFAVSAGLGTAGAFVERCQVNGRGQICRSLARPARFQDMAGSDWGEFVEIEIPFQDMDWGGEFLRLTLPEGAYTLQGYADEDDDDNLVVKRDSDGNAIRRPSPDLMAPLPAPSDLDRQYLEQRPFLRFDVSPLTRDEGSDDGGFDNLSLSFDGGIYRPLARGNALWQTKWSGSVATTAGLAFNHLTLETGAAFNLLRDDWLPITVSAKGESDQAFDAVDLSAEARLAYVLPFNLSLQSGAYRPAVAPLINLIAAYGVGLSRPDSVADAAGVFSPPSTPDDAFFRVGYDMRWRIPLGENGLLNLHHAGLWNDPDGSEAKFHALWDLMLEIEVAGVTYFIGYQEGEAAPLFMPTETTRVGVSFRIGEP